jgi:alkanesulfonate monooxygenase SsuD/methylene tetrahydromethanopterin reductase-like flavin-dependent oxidoreductase (luciferase family)
VAWTGEPVDYDGRHVQLRGAICTPAPPAPPRVVVGVGGSRRVLGRVLDLADEVNLYAEPDLVDEAQRRVADGGRPVGVSVFLAWEWDRWPAEPAAELARWAERGVDRVCVSLAGPDMVERIRALAAAAAA